MNFDIVKNYLLIFMFGMMGFFMILINQKDDEINKIKNRYIIEQQNKSAYADTTHKTVYVEKLEKDTIIKWNVKTKLVVDTLTDTLTVKELKDTILYSFSGNWKNGLYSGIITHNLKNDSSKYKLIITQNPYNIRSNLYMKDKILMNSIVINEEPSIDIRTSIDNDTFDKLVSTKKKSVFDCLKLGLDVTIDNDYKVKPVIIAGYFDKHSLYGFVGNGNYGIGIQTSLSISQMINTFSGE